MTSKELVLGQLEKHRGSFCSGEAMAVSIGISRAAIWKAVKDLRSDGYAITASPKLGYRLSVDNDILSASGIAAFLSDATIPILYFDTVDSTNRIAKELALRHAEHGTLVVAREQTAGKGRNGRSFFSPASTGLYMSMILRPDVISSVAIRITTAVAVAVCRAIESVVPVEARIKWVNDIFVNGKKVCGILTEGITGFESGRIESIVVGIGLNVSTPVHSFPTEIRSIATSLYPDGSLQPNMRNQLAASIATQVLSAVSEIEHMSFLSEYRKRSLVLARRITVSQGASTYLATAKEIDNDGSLIVVTEDNVRKILNSGEVSLRPAYDDIWNSAGVEDVNLGERGAKN